MEVLRRLSRLSFRIKDERTFESVIVGKDYLGKTGEKHFDVLTSTGKSEGKGREDASSHLACTKQNGHGTSDTGVAVADSGETKGNLGRGPSTLEGLETRTESKRTKVQAPSADNLKDLLPVLVKLSEIGEELIPILKALSEMGETRPRLIVGPANSDKALPSESMRSDRTAASTAISRKSSTKTEEHSPLPPVPSRRTAARTRSKTPTASTARRDSSLNLTTSMSNESDTNNTGLTRWSPQEEAAFTSFQKLCSTHGLLKRPSGIGEHDVCDGINDQATLRYNTLHYGGQTMVFHSIMSNTYMPDDSSSHFKEAWDSREAHQLCTFYEKINVHDFEETRNLYPHWTGRRDKSGQPICMFDFGKLDSKTMAAYKKTSAEMKKAMSNPKTLGTMSMEMLRAFAVYELLTRFTIPLCATTARILNVGNAITKIVCVVDISGIGLKQVWNLRGYLQDLSKLFATSYPEILDRVLIIGAPSYFPTIWSWIKNWVDPNTVSKLFILTPDEVLPTLKQYIDVANIPQRFGGEFDYQHGMQPNIDPVIAKIMSWVPPSASLPMGPMKWVDTGKNKRMAVAIGTSEGQARNENIAVLDSKKRFSGIDQLDVYC
ncbi:hypothetical protein MMC13_008140 [Lambiella insularis]|nr:hypothetical protein [Lambiella insularis]